MMLSDLVCGQCGACDDCENVMPDTLDAYVSVVAEIVRVETMRRVDGQVTWRRFDMASADDGASLRNFFNRRVTPAEIRRALSHARTRGYTDPNVLYRAACGAIWTRVRSDGRDPRGPKPDYYAAKRLATGTVSGWTPWTDDEERRLLRYVNLGLDPQSIALLHGRTQRAVETRIARLGATVDPEGHDLDGRPFSER